MQIVLNEFFFIVDWHASCDAGIVFSQRGNHLASQPVGHLWVDVRNVPRQFEIRYESLSIHRSFTLVQFQQTIEHAGLEAVEVRM